MSGDGGWECLGLEDSGFHDISESEEVQLTGIKKSHWQNASSQSQCASCSQKFSWKTWAHNCYRCGHLFCKKCRGYKRRLNLLSNPDPNGRLYKVCQSCFDQGPQTLGQTRDLREIYNEFHHKSLSDTSKTGVNVPFCFERECQRLRDGFRRSVGGSEVKRAWTEVTSLVSTPDWQKPFTKSWATFAPTCRGCSIEFSLTSPRKHCSVCNTSVCKTCSSKDLIVYIPDGQSSTAPQLAVIKVVGCPEVEPAVCLYLRVCQSCRQRLVEVQCESCEDEAPPHEASLEEIVRLSDRLRTIHTQVEQYLPKYQELIEGLESTSVSSDLNSKHHSNMQVLARAQGELSEVLVSLSLLMQQFRHIKGTTPSQGTLVKNLLRAHYDFYHESMYLFRDLKRKLQSCTPVEVLEYIQQTVDHNAINSCYLSMKQLVLETLHLTEKHKLDNKIVLILMPIEEVVRADLKLTLSQQKTSWPEHEKLVNDFLETQLKSHRLIRPSRTMTRAHGAVYVTDVVCHKTRRALRHAHSQLSAKCLNTRFTKTKTILESVMKSLDVMEEERREEKHDEDWVVVTN